jgi:hypothetical protein
MKSKRPVGVTGRRGSRAAYDGSEQPHNAAVAVAPQPILVEHSEFAAVCITTSRDHNRVDVEILLRQRGQWVPGGPVPSFPASMIDTVIAGLQQMRDALAAGRVA